MRTLSFCLAIMLAACGNHSPASGDDGGTTGDDGGGGDDGNDHAGSVTVTLTDRPMNAAMFSFVVAYQDGSGPWQVAPAPAGDTYTLPIHAPVWGVAWTCIGNALGSGSPGGQLRQVAEYHFAMAERTSLTVDVPPRCTDRNPMPASLHGTISNAIGAGTLIVRWGDRSTVANSQGQFQLPVAPGTHDLLVLHPAFNPISQDLLIDELYVQRGVAVTGNTTANVDWQNAAAVQMFGVDLSGAGRVVASTTVYTAAGTTAALVNDSAPEYETVAFDPDLMAAGDVYDQSMMVQANGQTAITTNATADPADQIWDAPAPLGGATSMVAASPYPRITTMWAAYPSTIGYSWLANQTLSFQQCGGNSACNVTWAALLSPGVMGAMPSYTMADLSAIAGWNPQLQLQPGTLVTGAVQAMTSSAGASDFPQVTPPAAGTQRAFVRSDYTVAP